jgi:hypothetical protein
MWFFNRKVKSEPVVYTLTHLKPPLEYIPQVLTISNRQKERIVKESTISPSEALEAVLHIIYRLEDCRYMGNTEKSIFLETPRYRFTFDNVGDLSAIYCIDGRPASQKVWDINPCSHLSSEEKQVLGRMFREFIRQ